MAWPVHRINSWAHFDVLATHLCPPPSVKYFYFRGQANADWPLRPSLARIIPPGSMTAEEIGELEQAALNEFIEHVKNSMKEDSRLLSHPPQHTNDWAGLMQHYRVPTLFLDWTCVPYIAAYFAVASLSPEHWNSDGAVWFFDERYVEAFTNARMYSTATINKRPDNNLRMFSSYIPVYTDARMAAQHGLFTWYRDVDKTHDAVIDNVLSHLVTHRRDEHGNLTQEVIKLPNVHELYGKIIIPAALKAEILSELARQKDISAKTVYTGLDGLGQSIAEFIHLRIAKKLDIGA
jgi:FRG domain